MGRFCDSRILWSRTALAAFLPDRFSSVSDLCIHLPSAVRRRYADDYFVLAWSFEFLDVGDLSLDEFLPLIETKGNPINVVLGQRVHVAYDAARAIDLVDKLLKPFRTGEERIYEVGLRRSPQWRQVVQIKIVNWICAPLLMPCDEGRGNYQDCSRGPNCRRNARQSRRLTAV